MIATSSMDRKGLTSSPMGNDVRHTLLSQVMGGLLGRRELGVAGFQYAVEVSAAISVEDAKTPRLVDNLHQLLRRDVDAKIDGVLTECPCRVDNLAG